MAIAATAPAAQLTGDARAAIPHDVQQLVVIDYRAMQNSSTAMELRDRVMPPDLKQFDEAIRKSGLNDNHDVDQLAFALFRTENFERQTWRQWASPRGSLTWQDIMANFRKQKVRPSWFAPIAFIRWPTRAWCFVSSIRRPWSLAARKP